MQLPLFPLVLAALVVARTDLNGCTSSETVINWGASYVYWVPGTGEICSLIDCGGGRAPPATTVPGCPQYKGTATYSPQYLPGYGDPVASSTSAIVGASTQSSAMITGSQTTSAIASQQTSSISVTNASPLSSSVSSAVLSTSVTGTITPSGSQFVSSSTSGTQSQSSSKSVTFSSSAVTPTVGGNSGTKVGYLPQGIIGGVAAGFVFLL